MLEIHGSVINDHETDPYMWTSVEHVTCFTDAGDYLEIRISGDTAKVMGIRIGYY